MSKKTNINLRKTIFEPGSFFEKAKMVFQYQYEQNSLYQSYCDLVRNPNLAIKQLEDIPFLPISFFKSHQIILDNLLPEITFSSSGTSGNLTSKHLVSSISIYEESFINYFKTFYGEPKEYCFLCLLPSYLERSGSSLIYMMEKLVQLSGHTDGGFYLYNHDELQTKLNKLRLRNQKTILIGVSFALLDFAENNKVKGWDNLIVMETGGMKGRRKELIRKELHEILCKSFNVSTIHSEYGMTELLSQGYSSGNGKFKPAPWMKVLIRNQDDPFSYCLIGQTGGINVIDLANLNSCSFIQTDDLGRISNNDTFEILGRFDQSDVRGCNLMIG